MRIVTLLFLCYQAIDFATTIIGVKLLGAQELNPIVVHWGWLPFIIIKLFGILIVTLILQLKKPSKSDIIVPLFMVPFMVYNAIQLILSW